MSDKIDFKIEAIDLVSDLARINPAVTIDKVYVEEEDEATHVEIHSSDESGTLLYHWKAPVDNFNFVGNDIAFHKFNVFADSIGFVEDPEIIQSTTEYVTVKGGKTEIRNSITEPRFIPGDWPAEITEDTIMEDGEITTKFVLTADTIKDILKAQSKIIGNDTYNLITLTAEGEGDDAELRFNLSTKNHYNTYDSVLAEADLLDGDLDFTFYTSVLSSIPTLDYTVELNDSVIKFSANELINDMQLDFYVMEVVD